MKIAYLDCFSGISGDMFLGALLDAGLPFEDLEKAMKSLPFDGYSLEMKREIKNHLTATRFIVNQTPKKYLHRGVKVIKEIIQDGDLSEKVKERSIRIFENIAGEEGRIHNQSLDEIHFHEVGAVDSIIDIVGTVFGMEHLKIGTVYASEIPLGSGFIKAGHGRIPVPAPATIALLKGIPVYDSGLKVEMVTPTGAALVKEFASSFGLMPSMTVEMIGYGAGTRDLDDRPNLFRILIGREPSKVETETVVVLEANLDDTNPEWLGFLMDRLFAEGALDVVFCPVQMKKNRPGIQVQIMAEPHRMNELMDALFLESTTLGVRFRYSQRRILDRTESEINSPWGKMRVKKVTGPDGSSFMHPEYESCRKIAETKEIPIKEIYYWVISQNKSGFDVKE